MVDEALEGLSGKFSKLISIPDAPPIPTEQLLRTFFTVRLERQLMQHINCKTLYR